MSRLRLAAVGALVLATGVTPHGVAAAAPTCTVAPSNVSPALTWPQRRLDYARVWPITRGAGVTVAVVDSGVDAQHPQLTGRVRSGLDIVHGSGTADTDCLGHGTFVAGIIAAAPEPGVGFAGVAPAATILPVRQTDIDQQGTADGLATAIRVATDAGASLINVSVVTTTSTPALARAVAYAEHHDALVVAAAANDATVGNPRTYPAAFPTVLAVGAVGPDDRRSGFSETGNFIDIAASGADVVSIGPGGPGELVGSGTSYAAPFVSGVAALVRAYHPGLSAAQVRHRLEVTADHPAATLPDPQVGWGVVDPYAAVTAVLPEEAAAPAAAARAATAVAAHAAPPREPSIRPLQVAAGCAALAALAALVGAVTRRGRRRQWRPGPTLAAGKGELA